jgi:hypothetical protein
MPTIIDRQRGRSEVARWRAAVQSHIVKHAELGGDGQDQPYEQALANLAHAYLKDKAPGLLDYEVGFQLLDRNEDNSKAVGVRGFKVGSQILYAPVFFIDGDLKGNELLYIKNDDQFVPLKENWINYLLKKKPLSLGEGVHKDLRRIGVRAPTLSRIVHSPSKFASAMPGWLQQGLPALAYAATTNPYTDPRYKDVRTLPTLLKEGGIKTVRALLKYAQTYPGIARGLDQFYDLKLIQDLLADLKREKTAAAVSVLSGLDVPPYRPLPGWARGDSVLGDVGPEHPIKKGSLQVYTYNPNALSKLPKTLTVPDTENLLENGMLIKDQREVADKSVAYKVQMRQAMVNPDTTGLYDILVKPDVLEKMLVIIGPHGPDGRKVFATVARVEGEPKGWINVHASYLWAAKQYSDEDWKNWVESLPDADTLTGDSDGQYIVVGPGRPDGTLPFIVEGSVGSNEGYKMLNVRFDMFAARPRPASHRGITLWSYYKSRLSDPVDFYDRWNDGERIHLGAPTGSEVRSRMGDLFMPKGSKLFTVEKADYDDDQWDVPEEDLTKVTRPIKSLTGGKGESKTPPVSTAHVMSIEMGMWRDKVGSTIPHHRIAIAFDGSRAAVNGRRSMTEKQAIVHLVRDHGFTEGVARNMLKMAEENRFKKPGPALEFRVEYAPWVKQARGPYMTDEGPTAPAIPDPTYSSGNFMNPDYPSQDPQSESIPVDGMFPDPANRELQRPNTNLDPDPPWRNNNSASPDPGAAQAATEAAATGQREIFDTSMLGSLLKTTRDDQLTDRYLGDLMKGMDRIGRILFQLYWHREAFEERYGKSHVPELEDMLRNSFEDMGDLVLDLKQKTVEADPEAAMQRTDFKSDTND